MASRRSRLQIKPNILSGLSTKPVPKSTKSVPKSPVTASGEERANVDRLHAGNKVKSPTRGASPRKNNVVNTFKEVDNDKEASVTDSVSTNNVETEPADETVLDAKTGSETTSDAASLPTRARLRKFGKVNIGVARGAKADSLLSKDTIKAETKGKPDGAEEGSATDVVKKEEVLTETTENTEKKSSDDVSSSGNVPFPRRSRFPKAKPNIADAGRRRIKQATTKEDPSKISSVTDMSSEIPEIMVTDVTASTEDPAASPTITQPSDSSPTTKSDHPQPSDSSQTTKSDSMQAVDSCNAGLSVSDSAQPADSAHTVIQPKPSSSSTIVPKSLLKTPIPTIPVSPEKRARTLSTSEAIVVKRQRKPKVEAPTDQPPDRSTMKMKDLIRWNPTNNPMKIKTKEGKLVMGGVQKENVANKKTTVNSVVVEERATEAPDTPLPVPQVTIGPDGNIVINEKSLVLKGPVLEKTPSQEDNIIDETDMYTTYGSFRTKKLSKRWTKKDTKKFYKGLAMIGIDFFLINKLFPNRTRFEIKKKFKKEEKVNRALVERVLRDGIKFDPSVFDEPDEESTDEEPEVKKRKKQKTQRKKTGGKQDKEVNEKQNTAKKKPVKRKTAPLNYYEDDSSENEKELPWKAESKREDSPWKPPSVSQKDGEVVGILMDMSEGRLTADGQLPENVMDMNAADGTEKLIAVPFNKHNNSKFIPIGDTNLTTSSGLTASQCSTTGYHNNPEMQSSGLNVGDTGWKNKPMKSPVATVVNRQPSLGNQNYSNTCSRRIYLPTFNKKDSTVSQSNIQTNVEHDVNLYNTAVQYEPGSSENNAIAVTSQLEQGTSSNQLQPVSITPVPGSQDNAEDADQYVLVTVMPEGGGETVIHIYRLHGGVQSQEEQVLYTDQYTPALTQDYTNNDVVPLSLTQSDLQEMSDDEIPLELRHKPPPLEIRHETPPLEIQHESLPLKIHESPPLEIQHETLPVEIRHESPPLEIRHELPPAEIQHELPPVEIQHELPPVEIPHESPPLEIHHESPPLEIQHELPPVEIQHESPPVEIQHESPPVEIRLETPPVEIQQVEMRHESPPLEIRHEALPVEIRHEALPVEIRHEALPVEMSTETGYAQEMVNESNSVDSTSNFISTSDDSKPEIYINASEMMVNESEQVPGVENC